MTWFLGAAVLAALSAAAGSRLPAWTIVVGPAVSLAVGAVTVANEPPGYDMPGFGYYLGAFGAVLSLGAWVAGRAIASLSRRRRDGRP